MEISEKMAHSPETAQSLDQRCAAEITMPRVPATVLVVATAVLLWTAVFMGFGPWTGGVLMLVAIAWLLRIAEEKGPVF
jgi:hypothetical protein